MKFHPVSGTDKALHDADPAYLVMFISGHSHLLLCLQQYGAHDEVKVLD